MFKLESEKALMDAFRTKDRPQVELTRELQLPLFVRHYVAWKHPAGERLYLVFAVPGGAPTGIVFDSFKGEGLAVPQMCHWCHSPSAGADIAMLMTKVSSKRTIGVQVCADLSCQRKLEDEADRSGRSVLPAMNTLLERMGRFAHEGLGIELTAAGR